MFWSRIREQPHMTLALKFAALVIVAAEDYNDAREVLGTVHQDNGVFFGDYNSAMARIESCLMALDRACRIADQRELRSVLPDDVTSRLLSRNQTSQISRLRNAIDHADKDILRDQAAEGDYVLLYGDVDGLRIGSLSASWELLAGWINGLSSATKALLLPPRAVASLVDGAPHFTPEGSGS